MKSALVLSEDSRLFETAREVITRLGGTSVEDVAQMDGPDGFLLTAFRVHDPGDYVGEEPFVLAEGAVDAPDMAHVHAADIECRSEALFVDVGRSIAAAARHPVWVLDGNSVLWPADRLDPATIVL